LPGQLLLFSDSLQALILTEQLFSLDDAFSEIEKQQLLSITLTRDGIKNVSATRATFISFEKAEIEQK
jgi:hypothetical protein